MEFGVDQVHLTEIGLARVARYSRAVLDGYSEVCIVFHAEAGEELDRRPSGLRAR